MVEKLKFQHYKSIYESFKMADLIEITNKFIEETNVDPKEVWYEVEKETDYYSSETAVLMINGYRWETDEELEIRLKKNRAAAAKTAATKRAKKLASADKEYQEYIRLKDKFEKGN